MDDETPVETTPMKRLAEGVTKPLNPTFDAPRTYRCHHCRDKGYILSQRFHENMGYNATEGAPCQHCKPTTDNPLSQYAPEATALEELPWEIDGDLGKDRLRLRGHIKATLWIYPDGRRCAYDGNTLQALQAVSVETYTHLFKLAKAARRVAPPELTKPYRG